MAGNRGGMPQPQASKEPEVKPEMPSIEKEQEQVKAAFKPSNAGIEVEAVREGFFKGSRKQKGKRFLIPSMDKAGEWMKCVDPQAEKERQAFIKKKKMAGR